MKINVSLTELDMFEDLMDLLIEYTQASKKYIDKVESNAESVETYEELKTAQQHTKEFLEKYNKEDEDESCQSDQAESV